MATLKDLELKVQVAQRADAPSVVEVRGAWNDGTPGKPLLVTVEVGEGEDPAAVVQALREQLPGTLRFTAGAL